MNISKQQFELNSVKEIRVCNESFDEKTNILNILIFVKIKKKKHFN
jgi:hypothetical protein